MSQRSPWNQASPTSFIRKFITLFASAIFALILLAGLLYWRALPKKFSGNHASGTWTPAILSEDATQYLPDFSFAGYEWGESDPPWPPATHQVTDFGAIPDDGLDDTAAIQRALAAAAADTGFAVVAFPGGQFLLRDILFLERSNIVLRGDSSSTNRTILRVDVSLNEIANPKAERVLGPLKSYLSANNLRNLWRPYSLYAWSGGIIWTRNPDPPREPQILGIAKQGTRGGFSVETEEAYNLAADDVVQLSWFNREGRQSSLLEHVFGKHDLPVGERLYETPDEPLIVQPVTVQRVDGDHIILKEPLLHDIKNEWTVEIRSTSFLRNVGIEQLDIAFPDVPYAPHHLDAGYNGIYLTDVQHAWIRDVNIRNADTAILSAHTKNSSASQIALSGRSGHHSIYVSLSYGFLVRDFEISSGALHNPSFNTGSTLSVFTNGRIFRAELDQHSGLNHQNLFDNIHTQNTKHLLDYGGSAYWYPTAGRFNTFWNIVAEKGGRFVGTVRNAPEARLIGIRGPSETLSFRYGPAAYVEGLNRMGISVPSLYDYQLHARMFGED